MEFSQQGGEGADPITMTLILRSIISIFWIPLFTNLDYRWQYESNIHWIKLSKTFNKVHERIRHQTFS